MVLLREKETAECFKKNNFNHTIDRVPLLLEYTMERFQWCLNQCIKKSMLVVLMLFTWVTASEVSTTPSLNGWFMVFVITALLAGIAWVTMYQKAGGNRSMGDQILADLDERLQKGEISKDEYENRRRDLEI